MYCKYCGENIPENSKFCRYCGEDLGEDASGSVSSHSSEREFVHTTKAHSFRELSKENKKLSPEELHRKRNMWIGWVLIAFSVLGFIGVVIIASEGTGRSSGDSLDSLGSSPLPYFIDLFLGVQLVRQKEGKYLNWVFLRVILGLVIWGLIGAASSDWGSVVSQVLYSVYFIYLIKAPLTEKSLKIANYILLPAVVIGLLFFS